MAIDYMTALRASRLSREQQNRARLAGRSLSSVEAAAPYEAAAETASTRTRDSRTLNLQQQQLGLQQQNLAQQKELESARLSQQQGQFLASNLLERERMQASMEAERNRLAEQRRQADMEKDAADKSTTLGWIKTGIEAPLSAYAGYKALGELGIIGKSAGIKGAGELGAQAGAKYAGWGSGGSIPVTTTGFEGVGALGAEKGAEYAGWGSAGAGTMGAGAGAGAGASTGALSGAEAAGYGGISGVGGSGATPAAGTGLGAVAGAAAVVALPVLTMYFNRSASRKSKHAFEDYMENLKTANPAAYEAYMSKAAWVNQYNQGWANWDDMNRRPGEFYDPSTNLPSYGGIPDVPGFLTSSSRLRAPYSGTSRKEYEAYVLNPSNWTNVR